MILISPWCNFTFYPIYKMYKILDFINSVISCHLFFKLPDTILAI